MVCIPCGTCKPNPVEDGDFRILELRENILKKGGLLKQSQSEVYATDFQARRQKDGALPSLTAPDRKPNSGFKDKGPETVAKKHEQLGPGLSIIFGVQDKGFIERLLVEELDKLCTLQGGERLRAGKAEKKELVLEAQSRQSFWVRGFSAPP